MWQGWEKGAPERKSRAFGKGPLYGMPMTVRGGLGPSTRSAGRHGVSGDQC